MVARRRLFLRWALVNVLFAAAVAAGGIAIHSKLHGLTDVAIPTILVLYAGASALGGRLCWRADSWTESAKAILHDAHWLNRAAYACQMCGIMSAMLGFYLIIYAASGDFQTKLQGGAVALLGSFVGAVCSLLLLVQEWSLQHELERNS